MSSRFLPGHAAALASVFALCAAGAALAQTPAQTPGQTPAQTPAKRGATDDAVSVERGRYLTKIMGCNDCHTRGYPERGGNVAESQWLMGDSLGFQGPWGTTYPTNLRLYFANMSEDQWLKTGRVLKTRPPMPWFNVQAMTDSDLRSLYRYVRSLSAGGQRAPAFVPPGKEPPGPAIRWPAPPGNPAPGK